MSHNLCPLNIKKYTKLLGINNDQIDFFYQRAWATISRNGEYIASHKHSQSHITFAYYLKKSKNLNIIDVGSSDGSFSTYLSKFIYKSNFYCFEPLKHLHKNYSLKNKRKNLEMTIEEMRNFASAYIEKYAPSKQQLKIYLLKKYRLKVFPAERISNYGGSIRVTATLNSKIDANKNVNKSQSVFWKKLHNILRNEYEIQPIISHHPYSINLLMNYQILVFGLS